MAPTPFFTHDCKACTFLGHFEGSDLYHCGGEPTVIARFSSEGPDYTSGMVFAFPGTVLGEAKKRALASGLKCE